MNLARPKALKALEAVIELGSFTQYQVWKRAGTSFDTAHRLVHFLEEKRVVAKIGKSYRVSSWPGLLNLFSAFRSFPKPIAVLQLSLSPAQAEKYLSEKQFAYCLSSAWRHYDDYFGDPQTNAYASSAEQAEKAVRELSQLPKGTTVINIYPQDLPVEPIKKGNSLITGLPRTLLDLYSSKYAYAADNWIKKKALEWQPE